MRQEAVGTPTPGVPTLRVTTPAGTREYALEGHTLSLGRDSTSDIVVDDPSLQFLHALLDRTRMGYELLDAGYANGFTFQGVRVPNKFLADGDLIWLSPTVSLTYHLASPPPRRIELSQSGVMTIGRDPKNKVPLDHPAVSREHARLTRREGKYWLEDLGSANGTFVNGAPVTPHVPRLLNEGDVIRIGSIKFVLAGDTLEEVDESRELRLDARCLHQVLDRKRDLLQDISLSILAREFVAIVGVSGAGKTMLLNALSGFRPASAGTVQVNGVDLYRHYGAYHNDIGYVPQEDIIHKELTVYEALDYSARLRLPAITAAAERHQRIMEVLENLDLGERKDARIDHLSGGTRKRVSIGVELLTQPGLFFLDEATSGLDPGTESQMMRLLRKLADQGHTVLLVTHATKNVMLCDQVAFLAKGGYLAYYGPPRDALDYFGVQDFDAIYERLEDELTPAEWAGRYAGSSQHQEFVADRLQGEPSSMAGALFGRDGVRGRAIKRASALGQFLILSQRNLEILTRDRASLILMLMTPLLLAALNFVTWKKGVFLSRGGDAPQALIDLSLLALNAVFIGAISSMREIVKEADVYKRERMVVLKIAPYVLSKIWVGVLIGIYASAVFISVAKLASDWPDTPASLAAAYFTLLLTFFAGMMLGLLISAASPNQNVTPLLLILVVIPQLVFSGALLPVKTFGPSGALINPMTASKWSFEALVTLSDLGRDVASDHCWELPKDKRDALTEASKVNRCNCLGPNVFHKCNFPGVLDVYDPNVDAAEPAEPPRPGAPPARPVALTAPALEQYEREVTAYLSVVNQYGDDLQKWRGRYQDWREKRDRAIGEAEGLIRKIYDDFRPMFDVDLGGHWGALGAMMAVALALILVVQKRKDVV